MWFYRRSSASGRWVYKASIALGWSLLRHEDLVHWVFDRGALTGERRRLACVISAQGAHQKMTHDEFADTCARELARAFPTLPSPQWSQVIAKKRATIAYVPGIKKPFSRDSSSGRVSRRRLRRPG